MNKLQWKRDDALDTYEAETEVGTYLAVRTALDISELYLGDELIFRNAQAGGHRSALEFAQRDHDRRWEYGIPKDRFGAHVTDGVLGTIGDREIGPGHVVLSEERYQWLLKQAGIAPSWMPPLLGGRNGPTRSRVAHRRPDESLPLSRPGHGCEDHRRLRFA